MVRRGTPGVASPGEPEQDRLMFEGAGGPVTYPGGFKEADRWREPSGSLERARAQENPSTPPVAPVNTGLTDRTALPLNDESAGASRAVSPRDTDACATGP